MARPAPTGLFFTKMHGAGNDFVLIDNRTLNLSLETTPALARRLCARQTGVGADGLILLDAGSAVDFRMIHYNPDGGRASFCGNGARCLSRFAWRNGLVGRVMTFEADDGRHIAEITGDMVRLQMTDPTRIRLDLPVNGYPRSSIAHAVFTGTDHVVIPSDNLDAERVEEDGRTLRHHEAFQPSGTNVNFFQRLAASSLAARTYERGVEAETLSCGTGAVACAVVHALLDNAPSPVQVLTRSGETLTVHFKREDDRFREVCLEGSAHFVFDGEWIEPAGAERHDP